MPPVVIGGIIAGVGSLGGATIGALAQGSAMSEAQRQRMETIALAKEAASPSVAELRSIEDLIKGKAESLKTLEARIGAEEKALSQVDPIISESSNQILGLLRGETTKLLDPVRKERQRQRQALENQLADRLGPGFRTSSAGIEALNKFDETSDLLTAQTQLQAVGQLNDVFATNFNLKGASLGRALQAAVSQSNLNFSFNQAIVGAQQNIKAREAQAVTGAATSSQVQQPTSNPFADALSGIAGIGANILGQGIGQDFQTQTLDKILGAKDVTPTPSSVSNAIGSLDFSSIAPKFGSSLASNNKLTVGSILNG